MIVKCFGQAEVRVPEEDLDTKSEMRRYNASIILANVLSRRIQKVLRHTFQYQNWAECYRMKDVLEQMCTTRYSRVDRLPDLKVVGLSDEKLSSRANALSLLDGRVREAL